MDTIKKLHPLAKATLVLLSITLFIYGLIQIKNFLYPIAFGLLIAYLLYPFVNFLEKHGFPRVFANLIAILFAIVIVGGVFLFFYEQFSHLVQNFSQLKERANNNIENLQHSLERIFRLKDNGIENFLKQQINQLFGGGGLAEIFKATAGTIIRILILPVYVFLFLYYRTKFAYFIMKIVNKENKGNALNILRDISTVATKYMVGMTIVVLILCCLNSVGLLIIGIKYAILLGIVSAFFDFIPYFGTAMGGSLTLIFVLLTSENPSHYALKIVIYYLIIQFIENNILTPNIVGGNVSINPFFIITGLVMGSMIWGIPGMLVTVPFLAITRIICSNIGVLEPYSFLLGPRGTRKHVINYKKIKSFIKRIVHKGV